ncbi:MAG: bacillithiol biosynthesis deacetylase BshB1, partial [Saprospiraceae bacterium]|nr:bacillithiol biosynthesis deacetylase BshB1 [Saprospiraceae bacterium]
GQAQQHWRPKAVYHYIQDKDLVPSFVVDITPYMEQKIDLILSFRSQFFLPEATEYSKEPATPISGKDFFEFVKSKCRAFGRPIGAEFAEGFIAARTPGVNDLFDLV